MKIHCIGTASVAATCASVALAQTFQRLGACPKLGCVFPPDQTEFLAGQYFDIRLEVHAPVNGSEANGGIPDEGFRFTIARDGAKPVDVAKYFKVDPPEIERWNFTWFEDLFAQDAKKPSVVNVAAKVYRRVALYQPGRYLATLTYYDGSTTVAEWRVRPLAEVKQAKNVILFIGDGMTTNMITAARLIGHQSVNGKYRSKMAMDRFPILGHQMTHSIDSFITDSANSASALYTGHKTTVNAMGVYADSSPDAFDDPKVETIVEILHRVWGSAIGVVTTAYVGDATPMALTGHTRTRGAYGPLIDQQLRGLTNYTWTDFTGPDVLFGGGAEQFIPGKGSYQGKDYYAEFAKAGYRISWNKTSLEQLPNDKKALGIFSVSNLPVWLDRNVYTENLKDQENSPTGDKTDATDIPGLKEMTLKAVDVLHQRGGRKGFFLMSEGASIDKQMHALDYDRALGDLLEMDDTIKATIERLKKLGVDKDTLIIVTADHGHGFDVFGSADTKYLSRQTTDRKKRNAIGTYLNSGLSQYTNPEAESATSGNASSERSQLIFNSGAAFPATWDPRYTLAQGVVAFPDHRENYRVRADGPREAAVNATGGSGGKDFYANPKDAPDGFLVNGTLPVSQDQGVHSLTDVPVYAMGPCQELFAGTYDNTDVFFHMAECLGLGRSSPGKGSERKYSFF